MKAIFSILAAVAFTLVFTIAYADGDLPVFGDTKDIGTQLYDEAFGMKEGHDVIACLKDFSAPGVPSARIAAQLVSTFAVNDVTANLNLWAFNDGIPVRDIGYGDRSVRGSAAGGICPDTMMKDDETTVIWDHLLGTPGGSDLP